jgi:DNA transformation protein
MFGGLGIYRDGLMFGLVVDGDVYLKADGEAAALFTAAGSEPFRYEKAGRAVAMSYYRLPEEALDEADALVRWAEIAYECARRAGAAKAKKRKPKTISRRPRPSAA